jgi:hypothetical protein
VEDLPLHVTQSFLIQVFMDPDDGYISRNLVAQQFLIKQRKVLVVTDFLSEELKYTPCVRMPTGMSTTKHFLRMCYFCYQNRSVP